MKTKATGEHRSNTSCCEMTDEDLDADAEENETAENFNLALEEVAESLAGAGWQVKSLLVEDPAEGCSPVCDDLTRDRLEGMPRSWRH